MSAVRDFTAGRDLNFTAGREKRSRPRGYIANYNPQARTVALLDEVKAVLEEYRDYLPLTARQIYYRLIGAYGHPKTEAFYGNLCEHLANARRGGMIPFEATPETALRCPTAYACVAVIAQAVAQLPLHLYERTENGGRERATGHPLFALLNDQANEWTSAYDFRQSMMSSALRYDQGAFAWIGRAGGEIMELVQIPSQSVAVETDPITREPVYRVTERNGRQRAYDRFDILHIRAMDGVAPVTAAREAIAIMTVMERHAAKLFGKGARPSGLLKAPKGLTVDAMKRAVSSWNKAHSGDGGGGTAFLESDWEWVATQLSSVDAQFMELRGQQVVEIARPFRIPPPMLQDYGRATWSNQEEGGRQFLALCLLPWLKVWESDEGRGRLHRRRRAVRADLHHQRPGDPGAEAGRHDGADRRTAGRQPVDGEPADPVLGRAAGAPRLHRGRRGRTDQRDRHPESGRTDRLRSGQGVPGGRQVHRPPSRGGGWDWDDLLIGWCEMGGWPDGFFSTTPRLYMAVVEGRTRAERRRFRLTGWLAHTTASLDRAKKLPSLEKLVGGPDLKPRKTEKQSPDVLLSIARRWQVAFAGRVPGAR